ncbi:MAG: DUF4827 family protein [bacterium]
MKKIKFVVTLFCSLLFFTACDYTENYSDLLDAEEELIEDWLTRQGITILDEFPADSLFAEDEMYHFDEGIYIQLLDKGEGDTLRSGDQISLRYSQSTLDENPIVEDYWTTLDRPYPNEIIYGDLTNSCEGWQSAFEIMLRSDSHSRIIVPSKIGRDNSEVVPYVYEMKIRIVPR